MGMSGKRTSSTFICNVAATNQNGSEEKVVYIYIEGNGFISWENMSMDAKIYVG